MVGAGVVVAVAAVDEDALGILMDLNAEGVDLYLRSPEIAGGRQVLFHGLRRGDELEPWHK